MPVARWMIVIACALLLAGCSGGKKVAKKSGGAKATDKSAASAHDGTGDEPSEPDVVLPEIDKNSGLNLDVKRVRVFSPAGWRRASKSHDYLVRYESKPKIAYPAIVILAADPPAGFTEVTKGNHKEFVAALDASLADQADGKDAVRRKPTDMTVGSRPGAAWATSGEAKLDGIPKKVEKECFAVVVNGRMYTVEAWGPAGKLDAAAKATARAVAAALAVPSADADVPMFTAEPPPPAEPAEPSDPPAKPDAQAAPKSKDKPKVPEKPDAPAKPKAPPKPKKPT